MRESVGLSNWTKNCLFGIIHRRKFLVCCGLLIEYNLSMMYNNSLTMFLMVPVGFRSIQK